MRSFVDGYIASIVEKMSLIDIGLLKLYGFTFGILIGSAFPEFGVSYRLIFLLIFVVLFLRYFYVLFLKKTNI